MHDDTCCLGLASFPSLNRHAEICYRGRVQRLTRYTAAIFKTVIGIRRVRGDRDFCIMVRGLLVESKWYLIVGTLSEFGTSLDHPNGIGVYEVDPRETALKLAEFSI